MREARQGKVGAKAIKEGQGPGGVDGGNPEAVGHLVTDVRQLGGREVPGDLRGPDVGLGQVDRGVEDVGEGDFLGRAGDSDRDVEVGHEQG